MLPDDGLFDMKRRALLFDKLRIYRYRWVIDNFASNVRNEFDFLESRGIIQELSVPHTIITEVTQITDGLYFQHLKWNDQSRIPDDMVSFANDYLTRTLSAIPEPGAEADVVPICRADFPASSSNTQTDGVSPASVLSIALKQFPLPSEDCSWEEITDFIAEKKDKLWNVRRFLHDLASRRQTSAEIRDDIDWSMNEYTKAMKLHHLKAGRSFVEVYVLPAIELAENIAKFNWSEIAKGALSVKKREIELMEAEMRAPGREIAYIYDTKKRFGNS